MSAAASQPSVVQGGRRDTSHCLIVPYFLSSWTGVASSKISTVWVERTSGISCSRVVALGPSVVSPCSRPSPPSPSRSRPRRTRRHARQEDPLHRRPDGPLPGRRRLAVPPRRRATRACAQHWERQRTGRRVDRGDRPERVERGRRPPTRRSPARSAGTARTSASRRASAALDVGACASSRSTTARTAWLNGKADRPQHAARTSRSRCACRASSARGVNHLVVRVDTRRLPTDFPPAGLTVDRRPTGGWWNYGGLLREVYLRRVDRSTSTPSWSARPPLPRTCAATIRSRHACATSPAGARAVTRRGRLRRPAVGSAPRDRAAKRRTFTRAPPRSQAAAVVAGDADLYTAALTVASAGGRTVARATTCTPASARSGSPAAGCASTAAPVNLRGVGVHEDTAAQGLRDRRRVPRPADRRGQGARRDRAPHPLPAAPVHRTSWPTAPGC